MEPALAVSETQAPLGFIEKGRVFLAAGAAVLLLRTIGWMVAEPLDPELAVTFTRSGRAVLGIGPALLVLTVVAGVIGTVVAGRRLPEAGLFAAAIGLTGMSLRGGSMEQMLAASGAVDTAGRQALMRDMAVDCMLWAVVMAVTWFVTAWAWRWVWADRNGGGAGGESPSPAARPLLATVPPRVGWPAFAVTTVTAAFVIWLTVARTPVAVIARNQTIASVAAGLYLGAMLARYVTGISDARWYILAAPAVGLIGYLVGYLSGDMSWADGGPYQYFKGLATTPPHDLARPLPIDYIAVGIAGALTGFWSGERVEHAVSQESAG